jgi:hypothetical protein
MLQCEGEIKISEIQAEFGGAAPTEIAEYYGVDDGVPSTGQIAWSDFHCKAKPIEFSGSQCQCIDHYASVYYDGNGRIYIEGRQPDHSIHTGRGDCGGYAQGQLCIYAFDKSKGNTVSFNVRLRCCGRDISKELDVNQQFRQYFDFCDCGSGARPYQFDITGKIS